MTEVNQCPSNGNILKTKSNSFDYNHFNFDKFWRYDLLIKIHTAMPNGTSIFSIQRMTFPFAIHNFVQSAFCYSSILFVLLRL